MLTVVALLGLAVVMVHSAGMTVGGQTRKAASAQRSQIADAPAATAEGLEGTADAAEGIADGTSTGMVSNRLMDILTGRTSVYAMIAIGAMILASRIDIRRAVRLRGVKNPLGWALFIGLGLLAMTFVPGIGRSVNGASRWLELPVGGGGKLSFQPSEIVKWVMIVAIAYWCSRRTGVMHRFTHGMFPALLLIAVACGLIVVEDLGTATLVGVVAFALLLAGGASFWKLGLLVPPAVAMFVVAIFQNPYRVNRLLAFRDPWADPRGIGYHPIQSMLAIAQGGVGGSGLGNGVQKFGYLPEDTTDFIFAIVCEELGLAGAALVIAMYLILLWVGLGIVRDSRDVFGRLLGLGVVLTIGIQAAINIAVVTVVVPTKGIALPLMSSGGTGWIMTGFMVGLVASLERYRSSEHLMLDPQPPLRGDDQRSPEVEDRELPTPSISAATA